MNAGFLKGVVSTSCSKKLIAGISNIYGNRVGKFS